MTDHIDFNFDLAIARLDSPGDPSSSGIDRLRLRYPELDFLFDELQEQRDSVEEYGDPCELKRERDDAQEEQKRLGNALDEANARFAQLRDMILTLQRYDRIDPEGQELKLLAAKADEAQDYCAKALEG